MEFILRDDQVLIVPINQSISKLKGILPKPDTTLTCEEMMIAIDTNILIRHLTQDDLEQAKIVEQIFDIYADSPNSIFINNIVMCELIWVLERGYKYKRAEIAEVIKQILSTEEFSFENRKLLWLALGQYNSNQLDFADALMGEVNKEFGRTKTITFDQTPRKAHNFTLVYEL